VVLLGAITTLAFAVTRPGSAGFFSERTSCSVPSLAGTVVDVSLVNSGGRMMGGPGMGGMMRLSASAATVAPGTVSFVATNGGSIDHELVVLPLPDGQSVGARAIGSDGKVDESASLGEASNPCGAGSGDGITPGTSSWVTLTLPPGRYELVCDIAGHYAAGMYAQLTIQ
jgi:uncharacterized cupredoxin-like copper-binding protein